MSIFKAFFGLGKIPQVVKFFEFKSFDDVNKMGGAIAQIKQQVREGGLQLTKSQQKFLDDQTKQVEMVFEQLQQPTKETGIKSTQSAKIFDMEGKEIPKGSKIMGGKAVDDTKMIDDAIENVSPGFVKGDTKYNAELVAEDLAERMGLVYDDLNTRQRIDIYGKAYDRLSKRNFQLRQTEKQIAERLGRENKKAVGNIRKKKLRDEISKLDDKIEARKLQLEQRGVEDFETDSLFNKLDEQRNDLELKLDFEDMVDPENMAQGGRAGFFMGGANPKGLGLLRQILNYMSKKGKETGGFKGADLSGLDMLRLSNPKALNRVLEDVRGKVNIREGIMGTDTVRVQQEALREKRKGLTEKSLDVAKALKADNDKIRRRVAEEAEYTIIPKLKKQLMEGMGMSEEAAEKAARGMAEAAQNMRLIDDPPIITKEGLLQLENVLKNMETGGKKARDLNADGGRIGFKDGMSRRTFLKIFSGLVSLPIIGKVFAPLKLAKGVKNVPVIKTEDVAGKPEWFDQLVNKVIIEGDDMTKQFATKEREIVHATKIDEDNFVTVTQDLDEGAVRVEYQSEANVFGDPVQLQYKKPLPDEGAPSPTAEFTTAESGPVGRSSWSR